MHHQNLEKLKRLRLFGMARALEDLQNLADRGQLDFADQLAMMIDREAADRANAAMQTRLKQARLRQAACFENLDMKPARGLDNDPRSVHLPLDRRAPPSDRYGQNRHRKELAQLCSGQSGRPRGLQRALHAPVAPA